MTSLLRGRPRYFAPCVRSAGDRFETSVGCRVQADHDPSARETPLLDAQSAGEMGPGKSLRQADAAARQSPEQLAAHTGRTPRGPSPRRQLSAIAPAIMLASPSAVTHNGKRATSGPSARAIAALPLVRMTLRAPPRRRLEPFPRARSPRAVEPHPVPLVRDHKVARARRGLALGGVLRIETHLARCRDKRNSWHYSRAAPLSAPMRAREAAVRLVGAADDRFSPERASRARRARRSLRTREHERDDQVSTMRSPPGIRRRRRQRGTSREAGRPRRRR